MAEEYLQHYGVLGMHWGVRRYQRKDGTLTKAGVQRYRKEIDASKNLNTGTKKYGDVRSKVATSYRNTGAGKAYAQAINDTYNQLAGTHDVDYEPSMADDMDYITDLEERVEYNQYPKGTTKDEIAVYKNMYNTLHSSYDEFVGKYEKELDEAQGAISDEYGPAKSVKLMRGINAKASEEQGEKSQLLNKKDTNESTTLTSFLFNNMNQQQNFNDFVNMAIQTHYNNMSTMQSHHMY